MKHVCPPWSFLLQLTHPKDLKRHLVIVWFRNWFLTWSHGSEKILVKAHHRIPGFLILAFCFCISPNYRWAAFPLWYILIWKPNALVSHILTQHIILWKVANWLCFAVLLKIIKIVHDGRQIDLKNTAVCVAQQDMKQCSVEHITKPSSANASGKRVVGSGGHEHLEMSNSDTITAPVSLHVRLVLTGEKFLYIFKSAFTNWFSSKSLKLLIVIFDNKLDFISVVEKFSTKVNRYSFDESTLGFVEVIGSWAIHSSDKTCFAWFFLPLVILTRKECTKASL